MSHTLGYARVDTRKRLTLRWLPDGVKFVEVLEEDGVLWLKPMVVAE